MILQWERLFIRGKTFQTVDSLPRSGRSSKFTPRSDSASLREAATSEAPRASVSMLNVKVHDSTIGKRPNKCGLFGRVARECFFSLKRTWEYGLGMHRLLKQLKIGRNRLKAQQQIYNRMSEKERNQGVAMVQRCKEERARIPPRWCEMAHKKIISWSYCC